ncbi:MAG: GNAT family N-acetyltransferase [Desulfocapsaceae bacterium]
MLSIRISQDAEECARIWAKAWPQRCIFDLWEVRTCFASCFGNTPYFIVAEESDEISGLLALSWIEESNNFGQFPGETWRAKTWLEQNKVPAQSRHAVQAVLESVPGDLHVRYLTPEFLPEDSFPLAVDEVGFLFFPGRYGYCFNNYMLEFSGKSRKKLSREISTLQSGGISYRYDHCADIQWMFRRNLESFGELSYFSDPRFLSSYEKLVAYLFDNNFLRVTTVLLGGVVAAVDIGTVWNNVYTVLAGATNPCFPGVAKIINLHHLEWACRQRLDMVDFLCGDFGWKQRFHLTQRPLYGIYRRTASTPFAELRSGSIR